METLFKHVHNRHSVKSPVTSSMNNENKCLDWTQLFLPSHQGDKYTNHCVQKTTCLMQMDGSMFCTATLLTVATGGDLNRVTAYDLRTIQWTHLQTIQYAVRILEILHLL